MLSILIPIYNQDVRNLALNLDQSAQAANIQYEIILIDDRSEDQFRDINKPLDEYEFIHYHELHENIGRAKIRNLLAKKSRYERLLFLDGDSQLIGIEFIENYIKASGDIINGGRIYQQNKPNKKYMLHWKYGRQLESVALSQRKAYPLRYFHSNNFMCSKKIMIDHPFDEDLDGYGYEDLVWAKIISDGYQINHIDNPIIHDGLETTDEFLRKTVVGLKNLKRFDQKKLLPKTPLIKYHRFLEMTLSKPLFMWVMKNIYPKTEKDLHNEDPSLFYYQLYKLYQYCLLQ